MPVVEFLKRLVTFAGRSLEFALTGQSEYAVLTSDQADFQCVTDIVKGKRVLTEARSLLADDFHIRIREPVLLELFSTKYWSPASLRYVMRGAVGSYQPHPMGRYNTHSIHVLNGLKRSRFKAIVAHEMVHAYEREARILATNRSLREGFARWIEYKVLQREGEQRECQKLLRLRKWSSGRSIHELLAVERRGGVKAVLEYVHRIP